MVEIANSDRSQATLPIPRELAANPRVDAQGLRITFRTPLELASTSFFALNLPGLVGSVSCAGVIGAAGLRLGQCNETVDGLRFALAAPLEEDTTFTAVIGAFAPVVEVDVGVRGAVAVDSPPRARLATSFRDLRAHTTSFETGEYALPRLVPGRNWTAAAPFGITLIGDVLAIASPAGQDFVRFTAKGEARSRTNATQLLWPALGVTAYTELCF